MVLKNSTLFIGKAIKTAVSSAILGPSRILLLGQQEDLDDWCSFQGVNEEIRHRHEGK